MKRRSDLAFLIFFIGLFPGGDPRAAAAEPKPAFVFREVEYFHRWSKSDQHEITPEKAGGPQ